MNRVKNTLRYIALSYKINFTGGARLLIWMTLLILPSALGIINSKVYSGLIDSFTGLTSGAKIGSCFLWLTLVIAVRGAYSLLTKTKYIVFDRFARESDRKMSVDVFDNPTSAYENGDEIGIFIYMSEGLSNTSTLYRKARLGARTDKF